MTLCQVGSGRVKYGQYFIFWTYFQPTSPYFNLVHRIGTTVNYIHPPLRSTTFMTVIYDHGFTLKEWRWLINLRYRNRNRISGKAELWLIGYVMIPLTSLIILLLLKCFTNAYLCTCTLTDTSSSNIILGSQSPVPKVSQARSIYIYSPPPPPQSKSNREGGGGVI